MWDYFPTWRSDARFRRDALRPNKFKAAGWKTESGWHAAAQIPFAAFDADVRSRIGRGEVVKISLDYLDYDMRSANRTTEDDSGFLPDNVFALDPAKANVNIPKYMRAAVFE